MGGGPACSQALAQLCCCRLCGPDAGLFPGLRFPSRKEEEMTAKGPLGFDTNFPFAHPAAAPPPADAPPVCGWGAPTLGDLPGSQGPGGGRRPQARGHFQPHPWLGGRRPHVNVAPGVFPCTPADVPSQDSPRNTPPPAPSTPPHTRAASHPWHWGPGPAEEQGICVHAHRFSHFPSGSSSSRAEQTSDLPSGAGRGGAAAGGEPGAGGGELLAQILWFPGVPPPPALRCVSTLPRPGPRSSATSRSRRPPPRGSLGRARVPGAHRDRLAWYACWRHAKPGAAPDGGHLTTLTPQTKPRPWVHPDLGHSQTRARPPAPGAHRRGMRMAM